MNAPNLQGLRVAILVTNGFEQAELEKPRTALDAAGARTTVAAPVKGTVQGMNHDEKGDAFSVDMPIDAANPKEFDAVLLPGGVVNADSLRMNETAQHFVQAMEKSKKPIAVICHGPWLLVSAGLLKGRHITSFLTLKDDIRNAGGIWTDEEVVTDGNWVSSRKPDDIPAFNKAMLRLFSEARPTARSAGRA